MISTDKDCAYRFIQKMEQGEPKLGANINREKTLVNFDLPECKIQQPQRASVSIAGHSFFPWCGLLIDIHTAEVRIDYARFAFGKSEDALTVDRCQSGRHFRNCIKYYLLPRCQPILFDTTINSSEVIVINLTQMMLLAAVKSKSYIESAMSLEKNIYFLQKTIDEAILSSRKTILHRMKIKGGRRSEFLLGNRDTLWLGRYCFGIILTDLGCNIFSSPAFEKKQSKIPRFHLTVKMGIMQFLKAMEMPNIQCPPYN